MNERDLFMAALAIANLGERSAYLDQACEGEGGLRQRVEALLKAFEQAGSFLQQPAEDTGATPEKLPARDCSGAPATEPAGTEQPGVVLAGRYKLLEAIGEGGMGRVWMAQQTEPVKRLVAVKLIKAGMDSKQVIARFEAERQALALMDHPNIARVLDAGTTRTGRPYFVMDLVKGVPITRYCDEHRLTPRERLELFIPVCQAVQHAHQKGIIHRDLKPSNVLVALYDGRPVPKVIDFGVAKATGQALTEKTLVTGFGAIVGTLEYMSPEQAEINQIDIDTRSDIYSLGVLLYDLLTGSPPFTRKELEKAGMLDMLRVIREQEPPVPSTKLSTAEGLPTLAANRGTEPAKLTKLVRGDLDWIVMKALEKDRNRRYETANSLALELGRYLTDEPVLAGPPSAAYRLRKFLQRNRVALATAGVIALALVLGTAISVWQAVRATQAEWLAQQRLEAEKAARAEAMANFRKARQAVDDYFTLVSESTLLQEPSLEPLRKQLLQAALRYHQEFVQEHRDDPELQAELVATYFRISILTFEMGPEEDWLPPFQKGIAVLENLLRQKPDPAALESLKTGVNYANAMRHASFRDPEEALRTFEQGRTVWEELVRLEPTAPGFRSTLAIIHLVIGNLKPFITGEPADKVHSVEKAIELWQQLSREDPKNPRYRAALATSMRNLGLSTAATGDSARAEAVLQRALQTAQQLAADFPDVPGPQELRDCIIPEAIGTLDEHLGRLDDAEKAYRQMRAGHESLRKQHPTVLRYRDGLFWSRQWLGLLLWARERREEAAEEFRQVLVLGEQLNPDDPETQDGLAWLLATCPDPRFRDVPRAIRLARTTVQLAPRNGGYWTTLGAAHYAGGDYQEAVRALEKAVQLRNYWCSGLQFLLAMARAQLGQKDEARRCYEKGVARLEHRELRDFETLRLRDEAAKLLGIEAR